MIVHPRNNFKKIIRIVDIINPFLIIISIIGLFCEFTFLKPLVLLPNKIISILFVLDFVIRLLSFNPKEYFFHGYGWVDFLASLPGIFFFLDNTPLFAVFKIIKVGRFFKIIRILRFLRVFNFLKKMKSDSVWIQDRIMKIGITIVMIFVCGIIVIDNLTINALIETESRVILSQYEAVGNDIQQLLTLRDDVVFLTEDSVLYTPDMDIVNDYSLLTNLLNDELESYIVVSFSNVSFTPVDDLELPNSGIIIPYGEITIYQNRIMLALLTTLLIILTVMIFYMGFVFAKDMQIVQLIIDSFDAGDHLLLNQEAEKYRDETGALVVNPEDNEMVNLLKVTASKAEESMSGTDDLFLSLAGISDNSKDSSDIGQKIESLEDKIDENSKFLVDDAIKRLTPAIIKFIKKELKH